MLARNFGSTFFHVRAFYLPPKIIWPLTIYRTNMMTACSFLSSFFVSLFRFSFEISLINNFLFDFLLFVFLVILLLTCAFLGLSLSDFILTRLNFVLFLSLALFYEQRKMKLLALEKPLKNDLYNTRSVRSSVFLWTEKNAVPAS